MLIGHVEVRRFERGEIIDIVSVMPTACLLPKGEPEWRILATVPHTEENTKNRLVEAGFRARAFKVFRREFTGRQDARGRRETVDRERPMFPGYVFCDLRKNQHDFTKAKGVKGARDFLRDSNRDPCIVPTRLIDSIEERERQEHARFLESIGPKKRRRSDLAVGAAVTISEGPFAQFHAEVAQLDDRGRVKLLLSMFGGECEAWVDGDQVERV